MEENSLEKTINIAENNSDSSGSDSSGEIYYGSKANEFDEMIEFLNSEKKFDSAQSKAYLDLYFKKRNNLYQVESDLENKKIYKLKDKELYFFGSPIIKNNTVYFAEEIIKNLINKDNQVFVSEVWSTVEKETQLKEENHSFLIIFGIDTKECQFTLSVGNVNEYAQEVDKEVLRSFLKEVKSFWEKKFPERKLRFNNVKKNKISFTENTETKEGSCRLHTVNAIEKLARISREQKFKIEELLQQEDLKLEYTSEKALVIYALRNDNKMYAVKDKYFKETFEPRIDIISEQLYLLDEKIESKEIDLLFAELNEVPKDYVEKLKTELQELQNSKNKILNTKEKINEVNTLMNPQVYSAIKSKIEELKKEKIPIKKK